MQCSALMDELRKKVCEPRRQKTKMY